MAIATITAITENTINLVVTIAIGGASYTALIPKATFDALLTNADKQAYIISVFAGGRRNTRQYEAIYPALVGAVIVVPD